MDRASPERQWVGGRIAGQPSREASPQPLRGACVRSRAGCPSECTNLLQCLIMKDEIIFCRVISGNFLMMLIGE